MSEEVCKKLEIEVTAKGMKLSILIDTVVKLLVCLYIEFSHNRHWYCKSIKNNRKRLKVQIVINMFVNDTRMEAFGPY